MDTGDLSTESRELRLSETYLRSAGRRSVEQVLALFMGLLAGGLLGGASTLVVDRFPGRVIVYTAVLLAASTILVLVIVYRGARQTESSYLLKLDDEGLSFEQDGLPPVSIVWKEVERVRASPGHGLRIESARGEIWVPDGLDGFPALRDLLGSRWPIERSVVGRGPAFLFAVAFATGLVLTLFYRDLDPRVTLLTGILIVAGWLYVFFQAFLGRSRSKQSQFGTLASFPLIVPVLLRLWDVLGRS